MENKTINIKMSDIVKISFGWYMGKMLFDVTAEMIGVLAGRATKKIEKANPDIKVVKGKEETEE